MSNDETGDSGGRPTVLEPLPYHRHLVAHLKANEAAAWEWYSSHRHQSRHAEDVRLQLLKATYRLEREGHPKLHAAADKVREGLGLEAPLALYQSADANTLNAMLLYVPGEAHVVLSGPVLSKLSEDELEALIAHELGHFLLYEHWDHEYLVASQVLGALAIDAGSQPVHVESYRLYGLYTEIYADRTGLGVVGDPAPLIRMLVKMDTGLDQVDAASYLRQADEILQADSSPTGAATHPELYLRARALSAWAERSETADGEIEDLIGGELTLAGLDLLGQVHLRAVTRRTLSRLLAPSWMRTEGVMAHARRFFPDFAEDEAVATDVDLAQEVTRCGDDVSDYLCYLMLDLVAVARELDEPPLALAFLLARTLGLEERLEPLARKELGLTKRITTRVAEDAPTILAAADRQAS